jgi:hypothetical protein
MSKTIALGLIISAVLALNLLRFWQLDTIPSGYHINELGSAVTMQCMAEAGCDAELTPWPLFGRMQYGQDKPPAYIYPGLIWTKIFGSTVPSLRGFSVFAFLTGMLGLFLLAKQFLSRSYGAAVVLAATCSPWGWVATRVAVESYFAPVFAVWGLYFFGRSVHWRDWAMAGLFFTCAMYSYPPARLQLPLMMAALFAFDRRRRPWPGPSVLSMGAVLAAALLPMAVKYIQGTLSRRFDQIGIFNRDYLYVFGKTGNLWDMTNIFFHNYFLHLSPDFLFLRGDRSYMYSTRHSGIFSWLDMAALGFLAAFLILALLRRSWAENPVIRHRRWLCFLAANFFIGIIPSALTNQELPHALRMCGSWPFMMLFTGLMWWSAAECLKGFWPVMALAGIFCGGLLAHQYFWLYPDESKVMFGYRALEIAGQLKTPDDWKQFLLVFHKQPYHCRYFLAHRLGMTCRQARDMWLKVPDS